MKEVKPKHRETSATSCHGVQHQEARKGVYGDCLKELLKNEMQ